MVPYSMEPPWRVGWNINSVESRTFREILESGFSRIDEHTLILSIQMSSALVAIFMSS